jgi:hypothetical protein
LIVRWLLSKNKTMVCRVLIFKNIGNAINYRSMNSINTI